MPTPSLFRTDSFGNRTLSSAHSESVAGACVSWRTDVGRMPAYIDFSMSYWRKFMRIHFSIAVAAVALLTTSVLFAQTTGMMNGGTWGLDGMSGYGGIGVPILLVIVVVGLIAWVVKRGDR